MIITTSCLTTKPVNLTTSCESILFIGSLLGAHYKYVAHLSVTDWLTLWLVILAYFFPFIYVEASLNKRFSRNKCGNGSVGNTVFSNINCLKRKTKKFLLKIRLLTFRSIVKDSCLCLQYFVTWLGVFYRKLKHLYFPYFTSEDMKKYVTHEKRVNFPAGFIYSHFPCSDFWLFKIKSYITR